MEEQPETEYMAMWSIILGLPLLFAMFVFFHLSRLEDGLVSFLSRIGFIGSLFPGPMIHLASFLLLLSVSVCVSSIVALIRLPRYRTWKEPGKGAFFFSAEFILLIVVVTTYSASIFRFIVGNLMDHSVLSILATIVGIPLGVVGVILLLDALFSRLWRVLLGYAPGIFKGQTYRNFKKVFKDKRFRKDMSLHVIAGLIAIPLVLLVLAILMSLGML